MKFYVYIADAKVDALLAEVALPDREQLARDLELDPAHLRADQTPRGAPDEVRFARATAVGRQLEVEGRSGSLQSSAPFVADRLELHWGRLRHVRGGELLRHETESPVAFAYPGQARELVMIGSASHLLAQPPKATVDHAGDVADDGVRNWFVPAEATLELDAIDRRCLEYVFEEALPPAPGPARWPNELPTGEPWMEQLARVRRELRALPAQRLDLVAKRVSIFDRGEWNPDRNAFDRLAQVVLAAPVSIAMVV